MYVPFQCGLSSAACSHMFSWIFESPYSLAVLEKLRLHGSWSRHSSLKVEASAQPGDWLDKSFHCTHLLHLGHQHLHTFHEYYYATSHIIMLNLGCRHERVFKHYISASLRSSLGQGQERKHLAIASPCSGVYLCSYATQKEVLPVTYRNVHCSCRHVCIDIWLRL